ncbi:hypothetical protein CRE_17343 [Caenorhabditis remanei]|uniref:Uncharacterized protein n=1 Tax=Caenorhabditis remanei TaxID=31234 RepID=E3MS06_CAERE|nr:hypothetical protein CRE_17343 [Caenorhabditis remanei]
MTHWLTVFLATTVTLTTVSLLKCTVCDFHLQPPHNQTCNETCEGDVCYIVINKYFNGTISAGCMHLREDDKFENEAVCQRGAHDNRCACTIFDYCNSPNVTLRNYTFTQSPVLENYQWLPQIQPPMPSIQPVIPPKDIPMGGDLNETATELENGVEHDLTHELDNSSNTTTQILRNEEENENMLTVTTTIGLNVRDQQPQTQRNDDVADDETTMRSFTPGQGSVEVTKVTQESKSPTDRNLTVTDGSGPNPSPPLTTVMAVMVPVMVYYILC